MIIEDFEFDPKSIYFVRISPSCPMKNFGTFGGIRISASEGWTEVPGEIAKFLKEICNNGKSRATNLRLRTRDVRDAFDIARDPDECDAIENAYRKQVDIGVPGTPHRPNKMKVLPSAKVKMGVPTAHIAEAPVKVEEVDLKAAMDAIVGPSEDMAPSKLSPPKRHKK